MPPQPVSNRQTSTPSNLFKLLTTGPAATALQAAAALGIPAALAQSRLTTLELAKHIGASAPHLARLLRALRAARTVTLTVESKWGLSRLGSYLAPGSKGSLHAAAIQLRDATTPNRWVDLAETVRAGRCLFTEKYGEPFFQYLAHHPEHARRFDAGMTTATAGQCEAMIAGYPFQNHATILDVGGGEGLLLQAIKARFHKVECILFELPHVTRRLKMSGPQGIALIEGDMFLDDLPQADAIILKAVLHDWDDLDALRILQRCSAALRPGGVLVVVELRIGSARDAGPAIFSDLTLMALTGGRERTWDEFASLYQKAGLRREPQSSYYGINIRPFSMDVLIKSRA